MVLATVSAPAVSKSPITTLALYQARTVGTESGESSLCLPVSRKSQRDLFPNAARSALMVYFLSIDLYSLYLLRDLTHQ
jgi:hypothetical protein